MELPGWPALTGHGDHLGVVVDADRPGPALGHLGDRAATAAAGVDHGLAGEVTEQRVGTGTQLDGHRLGDRRRYTREDLYRVASIVRAEQAGLPLPDIWAFLAAPDPAARKDVLRRNHLA